jgi:hypothetical protein
MLWLSLVLSNSGFRFDGDKNGWWVGGRNGVRANPEELFVDG